MVIASVTKQRVAANRTHIMELQAKPQPFKSFAGMTRSLPVLHGYILDTSVADFSSPSF